MAKKQKLLKHSTLVARKEAASRTDTEPCFKVYIVMASIGMACIVMA